MAVTLLYLLYVLYTYRAALRCTLSIRALSLKTNSHIPRVFIEANVTTCPRLFVYKPLQMSSQIFGSGTLVISAIVAIGLIAAKMMPLHPPYHSIVPVQKCVNIRKKSNNKGKYVSVIIMEDVVIVIKLIYVLIGLHLNICAH